MKQFTLWLCLTAVAVVAAAPVDAKLFEKHRPKVVVSDPYLELRTGPGRGFPIYYVAAQGDRIQVLKRKTDWFKIKVTDPRLKQGWVHIRQMQSTLDLDGNTLDFPIAGLSDFSKRRWEVGITGGSFGGASMIGGQLGFALTPNITASLTANHILGNFSDGLMGTANIVMYPFPTWRLSPFFEIGSGILQVRPHTTIVRTDDRTDEVVHVGAGANLYITRRFVARFEFRRHTVLTSRDDNEEINEWKAGFSVFM